MSQPDLPAGADRPAEQAAAPDVGAGAGAGEEAAPGGTVYDWYHRALDLLAGRNPEAAASLLSHAQAVEPDSASVREALARALFDARRYGEAAAAFTALISRNPDDDYAHFGLGLALARQGQLSAAVEHLALAVVMRPGQATYVQALRETRATVRARQGAAGHGGEERP